MRINLRTFALAAAFAPAVLAAQSTPATLDVSKIAASRDSFVVMVQGQPMGYQVAAVEKTADGLRLTSEQSIMNGMIASKGEILVNKDNSMKSLKSSGSMQGQPVGAEIAFANGRATGKASIPGMAGIEEKVIDAAIPAGVPEQSLMLPIVSTLTLAQGAKFTMPMFMATKGDTTSAQLEVTGSESVTVPAGTFDTWVVAVGGIGNGMSLYVDKKSSHVVKLVPNGQPVELQLAK